MASLLVVKAQIFATAAHGAVGQVRKYTGEAYYHHCGRVARRAEELGLSEEAQAAAWLHDTVEDTEIFFDTICEFFGEDVSGMVCSLTEQRPAGMNRAQRKALYNSRLAAAIPEVQSLKIIDTMDNLEGMELYDPKFCKTFVQEKRLLLPCLTKALPSLITECEDRLAYLEEYLK